MPRKGKVFIPESPYYTYEIWHHFNNGDKRKHKKIYCNVIDKERCKKLIKRIRNLPFSYAHSVFNLNLTSRFTIRKHRLYFAVCRWSINEPLVPVYFLNYKDGCDWIKSHYKNIFISNIGDYKNYLLKLTKGE